MKFPALFPRIIKFLFLDFKKHTGFSLEKRIINDQQYVVLIYSSVNFKHSSANAQLREKSILLRSFFEMPEETEESGSQRMSLETFYERLRCAHENDDFTSIPKDVQHPSLRPLLRPYQVCGFVFADRSIIISTFSR